MSSEKVSKAKKKKKKKKARMEQPAPPPFEPPALDSLAERGAVKLLASKRPASSLKKLCPKKSRRSSGAACVCPPVGEASTEEAWEDQIATCSAQPEGLEAPLLNVQLLAVQTAGRAKNADGGEAPDAVFQLMLQTRKGWFSTEIGRTSMAPGVGYPSTFSLASRTFVELPAGKKALLATVEEKQVTTNDDGERRTSVKGWLLVCSAVNPKKVNCTAPMALGAMQEPGGYQLKPVVEEGALYLVDTTADTPEDLKEVAGKYTMRK